MGLLDPLSWPDAVKGCPCCLDPIVLNYSHQTNKGLKVSYHLVYQLLTFPCNYTVLKTEATALSNLPHLQILLADGTSHHFKFVDTAVTVQSILEINYFGCS